MAAKCADNYTMPYFGLSNISIRSNGGLTGVRTFKYSKNVESEILLAPCKINKNKNCLLEYFDGSNKFQRWFEKDKSCAQKIYFDFLLATNIDIKLSKLSKIGL